MFGYDTSPNCVAPDQRRRDPLPAELRAALALIN